MGKGWGKVGKNWGKVGKGLGKVWERLGKVREGWGILRLGPKSPEPQSFQRSPVCWFLLLPYARPGGPKSLMAIADGTSVNKTQWAITTIVVWQQPTQRRSELSLRPIGFTLQLESGSRWNNLVFHIFSIVRVLSFLAFLFFGVIYMYLKL